MNTIKQTIAGKGERPHAFEDPLAGTAGVFLSSGEVGQVSIHNMKQNSWDADRDHLMNNRCLLTVGRSDDAREVHQADFLPPRHIKTLGESCLILSHAARIMTNVE